MQEHEPHKAFHMVRTKKSNQVGRDRGDRGDPPTGVRVSNPPTGVSVSDAQQTDEDSD